MTRAQLQASLALWRRRHIYRQRQLDIAHLRNDAVAIAKWHALLVEAGVNIRRREAQLAAIKPARPVEWMPGVRHRDRPDAGGFVAGPARGVLHTTEGDNFDAMERVLVNEGYEPQFLVGEAGEIVQFISIKRASKALEHPAGTIDTNRLSAIQIEVCGEAAHTNWPPAQRAAVERVMRFVEANAGVERSSAGVTFVAGVRHMTDAAWRTFKGWCGHQHVPNNRHWDPGAIPIKELL
jgi:hypothetical protein